MYASSARTFAALFHGSPGMRSHSEPLPCTTSSWLIGSTKFSLKAYIRENVIWLWWYPR